MLEGVAESHWGFETMFAFIYDTHTVLGVCQWTTINAAIELNHCTIDVLAI